MRKVILILIFVFHFFNGYNIEPARTKCVEVVSNTQIVLSWQAPFDPFSEFVAYQIFYSANPAGPYSVVATIPTFGTTSYTHNAVNLVLNSAYYFIQVQYDAGGGTENTASSDTLRAMKLAVGISNPGFADLSWNPIHAPNIGTSHGQYIIYSMVDGGVWQIVDTTDYGTEFYKDTVRVCLDSVSFKIEILDSSGCKSVSTIVKEELQDAGSPELAIVDSVSIDMSTGDVIISWDPGPSGDIAGYYVSKLVGGSQQQDTIYGISNTNYSESNSGANIASQTYGISSFDSCLQNNFIVNYHSTIYVEPLMDLCSREVTLNWTAYQFWPSGVKLYKLYMSKNGAGYTKIQEFAPTSLTYLHTNLELGATYDYYIRAVDVAGKASSTSNLISVVFQQPSIPLEHYLNYVTVNSDDNVEISCYVDVNADVDHYLIKRASAPGLPYEIIEKIPKSNLSLITYIDETANVNSRSYDYIVTAVNSCGQDIIVSNLSNTIHTVAHLQNGRTMVQWNAYSDWDTLGNGVAIYNLYRGSEGVFDGPIAVLNADETSFVDDGVLTGSGEFCYYVEAVESSGNSLGFLETSTSNISCVYEDPIIYLPNSFSPNGDGVNDVLFVTGTFISQDGFELLIYDRWGQLHYSATNINSSWDGADAPIGVYVYNLSIQSSTGRTYNYAGHITLIR